MNTHIIRYAKGHYGKSKDRIGDLKILIGQWSMIDPECLTERDVLECVYDVWLEIAYKHDREALMREIFFSGHHRFGTDLKLGETNAEVAINTMLGGMVPIKVGDFPELEDKYNIYFAQAEVTVQAREEDEMGIPWNPMDD